MLTLRLLLLPEMSWPVTGSTREAPSEKKSLAEELAVTDGRKAPQALRRWAAAVRTPAWAWTTPGWTRSESRIASGRVTTRSWAPSGARGERQEQDRRHAVHAIPRSGSDWEDSPGGFQRQIRRTASGRRTGGTRENGAGTPTGREVRPTTALGCRPGYRGLLVAMSTAGARSALGAGPNTGLRPTVYCPDDPEDVF